ncbi:MAG: pilus assembly protein N-terminal domain-containing protein [Afipia sp.]|nr:pilus assembly protein N-terminal domain-containing protein [Afipia sp.]
MSVVRNIRGQSAFSFLVIGCLLNPVAALAAGETDSVAVVVDQARVIKLPERVSTIVVGNPLIADVTLQPGGMVVVTGKGYGSTNMIAMDRTGAILADRSIQVEGPSDKLVTVFRGIDRESYSCTPVCQRRATLGDAPTYFDAVLGQTGNLNGAAGGSAGAKP